jgi:hypothetical protein
MAPADLVTTIAPLLNRSLARASGVFLLLIVASWGLGDVIVSAFRVDRPDDSRLFRPLLAVALGCGALGEALFIAGVAGDAYRVSVVAPLLAALAVLAVSRVRRRRLAGALQLPHDVGVYGWAVVLFAAVYVARWGWVSLGFNVGSDVFTYHYLDVKDMIRAKHFTHAVHLPFGLDHLSSYSPALARMLYLPGHLLADERASNMFHWLTQVMLIGALYVLGRHLHSRRAGLLAVGLYLSTGVMGFFPLETQDYTLMATFMALAVLLLLVGLTRNCARALGLGGVLAGLMLSTKYYALPIAGCMGLAILLWEPRIWRTRVRGAVVFGVAALLVFAPWLLYNIVVFHDPFYPSLVPNEELRFHKAVYWVHTLTPFVVATDRGFTQPALFYYLSLFVPFEPGSALGGLSVMFLIGLPCSCYCLIRGRGPGWRSINGLFVLSLLVFAALHVMVGHITYYKWALFPAVLYAASFALLVQRLRPAAAHAFWAATLIAGGLNYWFLTAPRIVAYTPPAVDQRVRWDEITQYLNATVEPRAVISGTGNPGTYYLRRDLTGMRDNSMVSTDWDAEEALIRRVGARYMLVNPNEAKSDEKYYRKWSGLWQQLSPGDTSTADYIEDVQRLNQARNRGKAAFLARHGFLEHEFSNGVQLYRLRLEGP